MAGQIRFTATDQSATTTTVTHNFSDADTLAIIAIGHQIFEDSISGPLTDVQIIQKYGQMLIDNMRHLVYNARREQAIAAASVPPIIA